MHIGVEVTGGIGGLRVEGSVDTETLPEAAREAVTRALAEERLVAASARRGDPVPDERQFRVSVAGRAYELAESLLDPDQVDALDALVSAIVRARRAC